MGESMVLAVAAAILLRRPYKWEWMPDPDWCLCVNAHENEKTAEKVKHFLGRYDRIRAKVSKSFQSLLRIWQSLHTGFSGV